MSKDEVVSFDLQKLYNCCSEDFIFANRKAKVKHGLDGRKKHLKKEALRETQEAEMDRCFIAYVSCNNGDRHFFQ